MSVTTEAKKAGRPLRLMGGILMALAAALLLMWLTGRDSDPHGDIFLLGGGVFLALLGAPLWALGYSITMLHRRQP
jgi:hypothetical protein